MRGILVLALVVLVLVLLGWISYSNTGSRASIHVETQEIEQDTQRAIEAGKKFAEDLRRDQVEPSGQP